MAELDKKAILEAAALLIKAYQETDNVSELSKIGLSQEVIDFKPSMPVSTPEEMKAIFTAFEEARKNADKTKKVLDAISQGISLIKKVALA